MSLDKYADFDKDKAMAKFKELKAKGGKFTLADIVRDEQGRLPKINTEPILNPNYVADPMDEHYLKLLDKYHKKATKIAKYDVSEVTTLETMEGLRRGFTYGEYTIFLEGDIILVESTDNEAHELAIYEIEDL